MVKTGEGLRSAESDLSDITIEVTGKDALKVVATLNLGGLATKHLKHRAHSARDSAIMENALKKLK
jgi:hypothetical protein